MDIDLVSLMGFDALNPMQETLLRTNARHVTLLAPTGSGKTIAFIGFLKNRLHQPNGRLQALIITPTRELTLQVLEVTRKALPGYRAVALYGGHSLRDEENSMQGKVPDILIATPGRLLDHMSRGNVNLSTVDTLIIDEMDKCLQLGFLPDIKKIMRATTSRKNFLLSSATMPPQEVIEAASRGKNGVSTNDTTLFDFRENSVAVPEIEFIEIPSVSKDKVETLITLLDSLPVNDRSIIFVNHRESAQRIFEHLHREKFPVVLYHGALEQKDREVALAQFSNGSSPVLVATDLAARGLDIPQVQNVIHYHLPVNEETWTHRNGRTARAGAKGDAFVIVHGEETIPEYIVFNREWYPSGKRERAQRGTGLFTAVFDLGKKEKISRGDILGFLTKQAGIPGNEIGKITVSDRYSSVALPSGYISLLKSLEKSAKIKNQRFRFSYTGS